MGERTERDDEKIRVPDSTIKKISGNAFMEKILSVIIA
jgi:hypothetical protein